MIRLTRNIARILGAVLLIINLGEVGMNVLDEARFNWPLHGAIHFFFMVLMHFWSHHPVTLILHTLPLLALLSLSSPRPQSDPHSSFSSR